MKEKDAKVTLRGLNGGCLEKWCPLWQCNKRFQKPHRQYVSSPPCLSVLFLGPRKQQPAVSQPFFQFDNNQRGFPYLFIHDPLSFIQRFWKAIMSCPCKNRQRWEVKALRGGIKNELRIVPISSPVLWSLSLLSPPSLTWGRPMQRLSGSLAHFPHSWSSPKFKTLKN